MVQTMKLQSVQATMKDFAMLPMKFGTGNFVIFITWLQDLVHTMKPRNWMKHILLSFIFRLVVRFVAVLRGNRRPVTSLFSFGSIVDDATTVAFGSIDEVVYKGHKLFPAAQPPKPTLMGKLLGNLADLQPWRSDKDLISETLMKKNEWYKEVGGKSVRVSMPDCDVIYTRDMNVISEVLEKQSDKFSVAKGLRAVFGGYFPESLLVHEGEKWQRMRNIMVRALHRVDFDNLPISTNEVLQHAHDKYLTQDVQEVRLWDVFCRVTFDSFHKFAYNIDFNTVGGHNQNLYNDVNVFADNLGKQMATRISWLSKVPLPSTLRTRAAYGRIKSFVTKLILEEEEKYRKQVNLGSKSVNTHPSFLEAMMEATMGERQKGSLTHEEMIDNVVTAMFGGFETTTSTTCFILINLSNNPDVQEKLYQEIKNIDLSKITLDELKTYHYLDHVVKESHRLLRIATMLAREAKEDAVLGDFIVKKGTNISIDALELSKDPEYWKTSETLNNYVPERWEEENPNLSVYSPFGYGSRICPGRFIAFAQLQIITCYLAQKFKISPGSKPVKFRTSFGLSVDYGTSLIFTKR